jgi:hypothetical protein
MRKAYCLSTGSASCCPSKIIIDVSCNPIINPNITVDVSSVVVTSTVVANPDAFGRARVSNPFTVFEFTSILGKGNDTSEGQVIIDESISGANSSSTWNPASYVSMDVSGAGSVIRQSHEYVLYQPGKSKLVYMTGVLFHDATYDPLYTLTGLTSRIGSFDASMGVLFECSGGNMAVSLRNNGTTAYVSQGSWNIDNLLGAGPCPIAVDFKKAQIFVIDFEWLGVGQVRCGIVQAGQLYYCHAFTHVNDLDKPYIRSAKLPLRYEINGTAATKNSMHMICGTVISEGGFVPQSLTKLIPTTYPNIRWTLPNGSGSAEGAFIPLLTVSLRPDYPSRYGTIKIKKVDIFNIDSSRFGSWRLVLNGTITGTPVNYDTNGSIAQVIVHDSATDTYTTGTGRVLQSDFWSNRVNSTQFTSTEELIQAVGINFNTFTNTSDRITLIANTFATGGTSVILGSMQWVEIM